jgi:hypothetical protein
MATVSIYDAKDHRWRDAYNPLAGSLEGRAPRIVVGLLRQEGDGEEVPVGTPVPTLGGKMHEWKN